MWEYVNGIYRYLGAPTPRQAFADLLGTRYGTIPGNPGYGGRLIALMDRAVNAGFRQRAIREIVKMAKAVGLAPKRVEITATEPGKTKITVTLVDGSTING